MVSDHLDSPLLVRLAKGKIRNQVAVIDGLKEAVVVESKGSDIYVNVSYGAQFYEILVGSPGGAQFEFPDLLFVSYPGMEQEQKVKIEVVEKFYKLIRDEAAFQEALAKMKSTQSTSLKQFLAE